MNHTSSTFRCVSSALLMAVCFLTFVGNQARATDPMQGVDALVYSTMPSISAHRPEMALDGDGSTYFKSYYGMSDGDDLQIVFTRPIPVRSLRIVTGDAENQDTLTEGFVEISSDMAAYRKVASFNSNGVAEATLPETLVATLRIRLNQGKSLPSLLVREITIGSPVKLARVQLGPGRGFIDISQAPDLAAWAQKAEKQMVEFWADTASMLYSHNFITPNKVNVVYRTGPGVTDVAAYGGGVITVNSKWAREQPGDTGLMVHEAAHAIQCLSSYNPVWLVEGIADYIRWVKYEPQNHKPRFNVQTASYRDSYRTTGTFLGWCEIHYDSALVRKLNEAIRFGNYSDDLWKKYCGKDVGTLWSEFLTAYQTDPVNLITTPLAAADRPRTLPVVKPGSSVPVDLSGAFNTVGIARDGATFPLAGSLDAGGASYSEALLSTRQTWKDVQFNIGPAGGANVISAQGQVIALPAGKYSSLWLLGAAAMGNQMTQNLTVTYTDGTTEKIAQHFSDWFRPRGFPGENRAVRMPYRNMSNGARDDSPFYAYSYGFNLNRDKTVQSLTLPNNPNVKILAVTLAN